MLYSYDMIGGYMGQITVSMFSYKSPKLGHITYNENINLLLLSSVFSVLFTGGKHINGTYQTKITDTDYSWTSYSVYISSFAVMLMVIEARENIHKLRRHEYKPKG